MTMRSRKLRRLLPKLVALVVLATLYLWGNQDVPVVVTGNYLQHVADLYEQSQQFVVHNAKCRIPHIPVVPLQNGEESKACRHFPNVTYVDYQNVVINRPTLERMGYDLHRVSCCYHRILRAENCNGTSTESSPDNQYCFSPVCYPMAEITTPISGFIKVTCHSDQLHPLLKLVFGKKAVIYENFHALAIIPPDDLRAIQSNAVHGSRPPNVLLIGLDSTSQLNAHRHLHQSLQVLGKMGALEMKGYTKFGDNTFYNMMPLLASLSVEEASRSCFASLQAPLNDCPFLWKNFSQRGYLTAHFEDAPRVTSFNYLKYGFKRKPVNIYNRPLMLAAYDYSGGTRCLGHQTTEQVIIRQMAELARLSNSLNIPFFITSWITHLLHSDGLDLRKMDHLLADTLTQLHSEGLLRNTLVLVLGDHGYRYGKVRTTGKGWFESKMPLLFIKPPQMARKPMYDMWISSLEHNAHELITPFDVYTTMKSMLDLFQFKDGEQMKQEPQRGLNILKKIPPRSCAEAGVPVEFCTCDPLSVKRVDDWFVKRGAQLILDKINEDLPAVCFRLKVKSVMGYAMVVPSSPQNKADYVIALEASPGPIELEAVVTFDFTTDMANVSFVQRINQGGSTGCLKTQEQERFDLFCRCNLFSKLYGKI